MEKIEKAIRDAVKEAVEKIGGIKEIRKMSWFPSSREGWTDIEGWGGD